MNRLFAAVLLVLATMLLQTGRLCGQADTRKSDAEKTSLRVPPKEPADALKTFRLRPGFRIELVAAEPLIRDPVAIDFDEAGRMYVVEYPEFNEYSFAKKLAKGGAVKLLVDSDGDGRFDKATTFLDKVAFPTAVICYDGGVFVGAAPEVLYCKDANGDGRADVRRVILTGFGRDFAGGGLLNSFRWGWDNRIHVATSFAGGDVRRVDRPDAKPVSVRGQGLLLDPRTLEIEATSGGGQHGMSMDDWGNKFLCSNVYPMQMLMYDDRYAARNPYFAPPSAAVDINAAGRLAKLKRISPLEPWRVIRSQQVAKSSPSDEEGRQPGGLFTSSSGITIYRGDAWPKEYRGNLFVGEVTNNLVYRAKLESNGVGLLAKRAEPGAEFLASTDIWFRPVQFANAPDGNLYVVDMYRELIEGAAFVPREVLKGLDPSSGTNRGRIYRIVADGSSSRTGDSKQRDRDRSKQFKDATTSKLAAILEHANGWHRDTASRLLYERQDRGAASTLKRLATKSKSPLGRAHALSALRGLGQLDADDLLPRLADADARVRERAVRLSESVAADSVSLRSKLYAMVADDDPRVRVQLAYTLGAFRGVQRPRALAALARHDIDNQWMRVAVQSSLAAGAGDVFVILVADAEIRRSEGGSELLSSLAAQIGAQGRTSDIALLLNGLQSIPVDERAIRQSITRALFANARGEAAGRLTKAGADKLRSLLTELLSEARVIAADDRQPAAKRVEAIRTLALDDFTDATIRKLFGRLLRLSQPQPIQSAALETLGKFNVARVAEMLLQTWPNLGPQSKAQVIETLFSRDDWTAAAFDAIEAGTITRGDISISRIALLRDHHDKGIGRRAEALLKKLAPPERREVIAAYQAALQKQGDADRGQALFKKVCSACHKLNGVGKSVGADLVGIGSKDASAILQNILDPNRDVKPKFVSYAVVTDQGRIITGMIVAETANSIRLQRSDGTHETVLRIHVDTLRSTGLSFMPEGLEKEIDVAAMADLLAYLRSVK